VRSRSEGTAETAETAEKYAEKIFPRRSRRSLRFLLLAFVISVIPVSSAIGQQTHLLVITGSPGDEEHAQKFQKWAASFIEAAKKKDAVPDANITLLADKQATKAGIEKAFADLAPRVKPSDAVLVLLIGHGSFNGTQAAFNHFGPDLTVDEWAKLLARIPAQRVAFVDTTSSSGAFLPAIAAPGRVVITATKTGGERNETLFPEYFVAAFDDPAADRDRNGHVSIAEAFEYAKAKVVQAVEQKGLLLTEHAVLDDGGGGLASTLFLGTGRADAALAADLSDPAMKKLVEEKDGIDQQIAALRSKKGAMDAAQYESQLEKLLTDLALKTKAIRDRQAQKDKR
jgi:hypothetical protein